jgi:dihydrofolate reductase
MRKLILYIASSLDGYIAGPGDDLSFLNPMHVEGEDYGYGEFIEGIDTVIVGRRTYDWVINQGVEFPHKDKACYIITRQEKPAEGNLNFYNGDLRALVTRLKSENGKNIFCDGGAQVVNYLLKEKLFDELIISVVPVLLGDGVRLFQENRPAQNLELNKVKNYPSGMVQLHYKISS